MRNSIASSLTAQIWSRRLAQAAADLVEPGRAGQSVSQIAFSAGFEDAAHFTRAFKRRFEYTPREWRRRGAGAQRDSAALTALPC
jgi:AraC family transcriptional regulator, positive regulator of tynA and feaB